MHERPEVFSRLSLSHWPIVDMTKEHYMHFTTVWGRRISHRIWNKKPNGPHWPVQPVWLIILFTVRHSASPPSTWQTLLDYLVLPQQSTAKVESSTWPMEPFILGCCSHDSHQKGENFFCYCCNRHCNLQGWTISQWLKYLSCLPIQ